MKNLFSSENQKRNFFLAFICLAAVIAAGWIAFRTFDQFPNSADEFAYLFQAQTYVEGRLENSAHSLPEFFQVPHVFHDAGRYFSKYPPGWPAILALGMTFKIPYWLVNPIIGAASLLLIYGFACQRYDKWVAIISTLAVFASPFFLFNSASYFSHPSCAFFILGFCWFALRYEKTQNSWDGFAAGTMIGLAFQTRYFTAALAGIAFLIYFLDKHPDKLRRALFWFGFGFFPWAIVFLVYNHAMTGDALTTPFHFYDMYDPVGFSQNGPYPHDFGRALAKMNAKWIYLSNWTGYAFGYLYLFALLWFLKKRTWHFSDLILLALMVGHGFHSATGTNQYGPRYYYEGFALAMITVVGMIFGKDQFSRSGYVSKFFHTIFIVIFCGGVISSIVGISARAAVVSANIQDRQDLYRQIQEKSISDALVFIQDVGVEEGRQKRDQWGLIRSIPLRDLIRNDIHFKNKVIYAMDLGDENNALMRYYPDKKVYFYYRAKGASSGVLSRSRS